VALPPSGYKIQKLQPEGRKGASLPTSGYNTQKLKGERVCPSHTFSGYNTQKLKGERVCPSLSLVTTLKSRREKGCIPPFLWVPDLEAKRRKGVSLPLVTRPRSRREKDTPSLGCKIDVHVSSQRLRD